MIKSSIFKYSSLTIYILTAVTALFSPVQTKAIELPVEGEYTGTVNGQSLNATSSGLLNTDGPGGNLNATFTQIAPDFTPLALGSSIITGICGNSATRCIESVQNLYDLTGGNYSLERTMTWPSFPGSRIKVNFEVSNLNDTLTYIADLRGTYNGPLNITNVIDYEVNWTPSGSADQMIERGTVTLETSSGELFPLVFEGVYSGLSTPLINNQVSHLFPDPDYNFNTGVFQSTWTMETCIPEPTSIIGSILLGSGLIWRKSKNKG